MSKTIIAVVVVGVLIVGGYFILKSNKVMDNTQVQDNQVSEQSPSDKKVAFSEFVKQGGSYKCEVKQSVSDMENSGTVYMSGGKIRGDFSTIAEGRTFVSSFILKDGYTYNWSSMTPKMGVKMKVPASTEVNTSTKTEGTYSWSANQIGDYNCEAWTTDQLKFELPAEVTFNAIGAQ